MLASGKHEAFWRLHADAEEDQRDIFSPEFKDLFQRMLALEPKKRPTIEEVLAHPWMQGPIVDQESWKADFIRRKEVVDAESKRDREKKLEAREQTDNESSTGKQRPTVHRGSPGAREPRSAVIELRDSC